MTIGEHKNIGAFEIPMQNSELMQSLEATSHLNEDTPQFLVSKLGIAFGMLRDLGVEVTLVCKLHDNAIIKD